MGADWEIQEMCGVKYEMSQKGGKEMGEIISTPSIHSYSYGDSSKQMLGRVSRKTYESCCLRRVDVPHYQFTQRVLSFSRSPPEVQSGGVYILREGENDLNPIHNIH